jgi:hypothetical protein
MRTLPRRGARSVLAVLAVPALGLAAGVFSAMAAPSVAWAEPPSADLLARLAEHAKAFESMKTRASYALEGRIERLDGDGKVDGVKEGRARVEADGKKVRLIVLKYLEDGKDKTDEARRKVHEQESEKDSDDKDIRMPFLASEQPRYAFDQVESDRADPSRVRITFVPREPADDTIEGSAWVDAKTARVLSAGFKLSKPGTFVDYVHVTMRFEADTPIGPAVSSLTFDGKGGLLFLRKHFRGTATFSDYRIAP